MNGVFEFLIGLGKLALPPFVYLVMLNVGLTQQLGDILQHFKKLGFMARMLLANFVLAPLAMFLLLKLFHVSQPFATALMIFSLTAGAPFLIKLTQFSKHDLSLGASLMLVLVTGTILTLPFTLPPVLPEGEIDTKAVALSLLKSLVWPVIVGMLLAWLLPTFTEKIQPWVAKVGGALMNVVVYATLIGYAPTVLGQLGAYAIPIVVGMLFVVAAFGIGWLLGGQRGELRDLGALGTAQRNTAAAMIIAAQNFGDQPTVFVLITLVNTLGIGLLRGAAMKLSRQQEVPEDAARAG